MKNKKVLLSVLSTAVVTSMISPAFAATKTLDAGLYIGGKVDKYYNFEALNKQINTIINEDLEKADLSQVIFVDTDGLAMLLSDVAAGEDDPYHDITDDLIASLDKNGDGDSLFTPIDKDGKPGTPIDLGNGTTPTGDLKVDSVSAINLTQIKVTFTKEVNETSAENPAKYTIAGFGGTIVPTLLSDGKTVLLTLSTTQGQSSTVPVQVANVQDVDGKTAPTFNTTVTFGDVTAPTITDVKASGNKKVVITLSEPVAAVSAPDFKLDGKDLSIFGGAVIAASVGNVDNLPTNQQYTLTFNNTLPSGSHELSFASATPRVDAAQFPIAAVKNTFTVDSVTTAPVPTVASATSGTNGTVKVTFDHAINSATAGTTKFSLNVAGTNPTTVTPDADGKSFTLTFTTVPSGVNVLIVDPSIADSYGNTVGTTTPVRLSFSASADTTAPALTAATSANDLSATLTFNEALDSLTAQNADNYVIKDANGTVVAPTSTRTLTPTLVTSGVNANKQVSIALGAFLSGGTYTVTVNGIKDASGNAMTAAASQSFTVTDTRAPQLAIQAAGAAAVFNSTAHTVEVFFNEPMQVSGPYSILDKANWTYTGGTLPAYVTTSAGANNKSVVFQFAPTDVITAGTTTFTALVAKDVAGNSTTNQTANVAAIANVVKPVISNNVKALPGTSTTDVVTFDVDQPLANIDATDFVVKNGATTKVVTGATFSGNTVTLTLGEGALGDGTAVTLDIVGTPNSANANGGKISKDTSHVASAYTASDVIAPKAASAAVVDTTHVKVTFNEALNGGLGALFKSDFQIDNNGSTLAASASSVSGNDVVLTLPSGKSFATGTTVKVYPVATPANVQDVAGNKYAPSTTDLSGISATALTTGAAGTPSITNGTAGTAQVETATAAGTVTTAGNVSVTVTAAGMTGTPKTITAPVALNDGANEIAAAIRTALAADTDVAAKFNVGGTSAGIILTTKTAAANDATVNVAIADGTSVGVTAAASSADTTAGAAPTAEVATLAISAGATNAGNVTVTVNGAPTTVAVAAGDTQAQVATKIAAAVTVTGYNVTASGNNVLFTSTTTGDVADLTVTLN